MRYRLRTLLIVVTIASLPMAWFAFAKQAAEHHRRESARIIRSINEHSFMPPEFAWDGVARHATQGVKEHEKLSDGRLIVFHPKFGRQLLLDAKESGDWDQAVNHHRIAAQYDKAVLRPWLVLLPASN